MPKYVSKFQSIFFLQITNRKAQVKPEKISMDLFYLFLADILLSKFTLAGHKVRTILKFL